MKTEKEIIDEIQHWNKTNEELGSYPKLIAKNKIYIKALKWVLDVE